MKGTTLINFKVTSFCSSCLLAVSTLLKKFLISAHFTSFILLYFYFILLTIIQIYDGHEGPLFSSMVSCEVFSESDTVLGRSNSFRKFLDSSRKSKTVLGSFKQFSEVSNSSRKFQTVLGNLKQLSEFLNSSPKSQTLLGNLKQSSEVLDSSRKF